MGKLFRKFSDENIACRWLQTCYFLLKIANETSYKVDMLAWDDTGDTVCYALNYVTLLDKPYSTFLEFIKNVMIHISQ